MKSSVFLETRFISDLTGPRNQNMLVATHPHITREWWKTRRLGFEYLVPSTTNLEINEGQGLIRLFLKFVVLAG